MLITDIKHDMLKLITNIMLCPVCEQDIPTDQFMLHAMYQHPQFFVVWASFAMPTVAPHLPILFDQIDNEFDALEYEELLQLCDDIGYHKVGVQNIDEVAPKCEACCVDSHWRCAICLDVKEQCSVLRRVKRCGHYFCSSCIETWLSENKSCPICKNDVEIQCELDEVD